MTWQKIYGIMRDENTKSKKTTGSQHGLNKCISGEILTDNNGGFDWSTRWIDKSENRPKIDFRFVKKADRAIIKKTINAIPIDEYEHYITINFKKQERFFVNGVEVTAENIQRLS